MITKRVFNAAFNASLPVLMGYLAMGMASGILLAKTVSIPCLPLWAFLTSAVNISGAFQFLLVDWVKNTTVLFQVVLLTICLNLRYAMYGFSLLERFKNVPLLQKLYLIWALTDETYAIQVANKVPEGEDSVSYCLTVAALDHFYWFAGVTAGAVIGGSLPFNCQGIDFAMTALFLVVLVDQCKERINRMPAVIGGVIALIWGLTAGVDRMLLPAIPCVLVILFLFRKKLLKEKTA